MFHTRSFSGVSICDVFSEKLLLGHVFLGSSAWGKTEKLNYYWISTVLQPAFLPEYKAPTFHSGLNQERSTCKRVLVGHMGGFVSFAQSLHLKKSGKSHCFRFISLFKLTFRSNYRFEIINRNLNWKPYFCRCKFHWEIINFDPCIKILIVQIFQKCVCKNHSPRLSRWCSSVTTGLTSCLKVPSRNFALREKDWKQMSVSWFFASKSRQSRKSSLITYMDFQSQLS